MPGAIPFKMLRMKEPGALGRVKNAGVNAASIVDLVAIGFARQESDVAAMEPVARKIFQRFTSLK